MQWELLKYSRKKHGLSCREAEHPAYRCVCTSVEQVGGSQEMVPLSVRCPEVPLCLQQLMLI